MRAQHVVTSGAALINQAVGINQVVIADIAPAIGKDVKIPDAAHDGGPVSRFVAGRRVMHDQVRDRRV